jgi:hypothetical protein
MQNESMQKLFNLAKQISIEHPDISSQIFAIVLTDLKMSKDETLMYDFNLFCSGQLESDQFLNRLLEKKFDRTEPIHGY